MRSYPLVFRCYAETEGDQWLAFCIDLTLAAQADTYQEARTKLHKQIASYVYDAIAGADQAHATYLLTRKAPLRYRVKYHAIAVFCRVRDAKKRMSKVFVEALNVSQLVRQPC